MRKTCPRCQKSFETDNNRRIFCEPCGRATGPRQPDKYSKRPFTKDTPFLCFKWRSEGDSVAKISEILRRPKSQILEAIAQYEKS